MIDLEGLLGARAFKVQNLSPQKYEVIANLHFSFLEKN